MSVAVMGILMTGLASAILLASRALPNPESRTSAIVAGADAADQITEELREAILITERTTTAIAFTVADRDNDGVPERIRYEWSGAPGDPLTRQYNDGPALEVVSEVEVFGLAYNLTAVSEEYPGPPVESDETLISWYTTLHEARGFEVEEDRWVGQYFEPAVFIPPDVSCTWSLTRVRFMAMRAGTADGQTLVQIRTVNGDGTPTETILAEQTVDESELSSMPGVQDLAFDGVTGLNPDDGFCLVFQHGGGGPSATVAYDRAWGTGRVRTDDGGQSWSYSDSRSLYYAIYGTVSVPGPPQTATRYYVTDVRTTLQIGDDPAAQVVTTARTLNTPEALAALWEANFSADPTLDQNGDGEPDWIVRAGGSFDGGSLSGGVWHADTTLDTYPSNGFTALTTVEVSFCNTSLGGDGAVFAINADWSGSTCASITASLALQADSTQTLSVCHRNAGGTDTTLARHAGLPREFVTLRLLIDPGLDTVNIRVNNEDLGTYVYDIVVPHSNNRAATLQASGSDAEFDYVSIRVSE